jgi:hypothetical protein
VDINKNVKNVKKNKKYIYSSLHSQLAKLLIDQITGNKPNFKSPDNIDNWANEVRLMMENDKRSYEQIEKVIKWCQKDSFWQSNILSIKKLREKFDQLESKMNQDGRPKYNFDALKKESILKRQAKVDCPHCNGSGKIKYLDHLTQGVTEVTCECCKINQ